MNVQTLANLLMTEDRPLQSHHSCGVYNFTDVTLHYILGLTSVLIGKLNHTFRNFVSFLSGKGKHGNKQRHCKHDKSSLNLSVLDCFMYFRQVIFYERV